MGVFACLCNELVVDAVGKILTREAGTFEASRTTSEDARVGAHFVK